MMEVNVTTDQAGEAAIRTGQLPPVETPQNYDFRGAIEAPFKYLKNRVPDPSKAVIEVYYERGKVILQTDPTGVESNNHYIEGEVELTKEFKEIHQGLSMRPKRLAKYLRLRTWMFASKEKAREFITAVNSIYAVVERKVKEENLQDEGSFKRHVEQYVSHNLPQKLMLKIPVCEGHEPIQIEVLVHVEVHEENVIVSLEIDPNLRQEAVKNVMNYYLDKVTDDYLILQA